MGNKAHFQLLCSACFLNCHKQFYRLKVSLWMTQFEYCFPQQSSTKLVLMQAFGLVSPGTVLYFSILLTHTTHQAMLLHGSSQEKYGITGREPCSHVGFQNCSLHVPTNCPTQHHFWHILHLVHELVYHSFWVNAIHKSLLTIPFWKSSRRMEWKFST